MPSSNSISRERMCFRGGLCNKSVLSWFFGKIVLQANSPPRRGGVAAPPRKCREATEAAQTGWSDRHTIHFAELTTIEASPYRARASRPARQLLLSCRATPPLRGGEYARLQFAHTFYERPYRYGFDFFSGLLTLSTAWPQQLQFGMRLSF